MQVGIQEGVAFDFRAGDVNGKPVLNIILTQPGNAEAAFDFDEVDTSGGATESTQITVWGLTVKGLEDGSVVDVRRPTTISADIKDRRSFYTKLLELFMDKNQIEWDTMRGLGITIDDLKANPKLIVDDTVLAGISRNLNEQFVEHFKAYGDASQLFRVPLIRTSKKDNRPKLRDRYLDKATIAEPMDVPLEESKVGFTASEIKAGLNNPDPIQPDTPSGTKDLPFDSQVVDPSGVPVGL